MTNPILDRVRQVAGVGRDEVPDDILTLFIGQNMPEVLDADPQFAKRFNLVSDQDKLLVNSQGLGGFFEGNLPDPKDTSLSNVVKGTINQTMDDIGRLGMRAFSGLMNMGAAAHEVGAFALAPFSEAWSNALEATADTANELGRDLRELTQGDVGGTEAVLGDVAETTASIAPILAVAGPLAAVGASATAVTSASVATAGLTSFATTLNQSRQVYQDGGLADYRTPALQDATIAAAATAAITTLMGPVAGKVFGKGVGGVEELFTTATGARLALNSAAQVLKGFVGEYVEEGLDGAFQDWYLKNRYNLGNPTPMELLGTFLEQGLVGGILGAGMQAVQLVDAYNLARARASAPVQGPPPPPPQGTTTVVDPGGQGGPTPASRQRPAPPVVDVDVEQESGSLVRVPPVVDAIPVDEPPPGGVELLPPWEEQEMPLQLTAPQLVRALEYRQRLALPAPPEVKKAPPQVGPNGLTTFPDTLKNSVDKAIVEAWLNARTKAERIAQEDLARKAGPETQRALQAAKVKVYRPIGGEKVYVTPQGYISFNPEDGEPHILTRVRAWKVEPPAPVPLSDDTPDTSDAPLVRTAVWEWQPIPLMKASRPMDGSMWDAASYLRSQDRTTVPAGMVLSGENWNAQLGKELFHRDVRLTSSQVLWQAQRWRDLKIKEQDYYTDYLKQLEQELAVAENVDEDEEAAARIQHTIDRVEALLASIPQELGRIKPRSPAREVGATPYPLVSGSKEYVDMIVGLLDSGAVQLKTVDRDQLKAELEAEHPSVIKYRVMDPPEYVPFGPLFDQMEVELLEEISKRKMIPEPRLRGATPDVEYKVFDTIDGRFPAVILQLVHPETKDPLIWAAWTWTSSEGVSSIVPNTPYGEFKDTMISRLGVDLASPYLKDYLATLLIEKYGHGKVVPMHPVYRITPSITTTYEATHKPYDPFDLTIPEFVYHGTPKDEGGRVPYLSVGYRHLKPGAYGPSFYTTRAPFLGRNYAAGNLGWVLKIKPLIKNAMDLDRPADMAEWSKVVWPPISPGAEQYNGPDDDPITLDVVLKFARERAIEDPGIAGDTPSNRSMVLAVQDIYWSTGIDEDRTPYTPDIFANFKDIFGQLGYDSFTHRGGFITGTNPHRVFVIIDPADAQIVGWEKPGSFAPVEVPPSPDLGYLPFRAPGEEDPATTSHPLYPEVLLFNQMLGWLRPEGLNGLRHDALPEVHAKMAAQVVDMDVATAAAKLTSQVRWLHSHLADENFSTVVVQMTQPETHDDMDERTLVQVRLSGFDLTDPAWTGPVPKDYDEEFMLAADIKRVGDDFYYNYWSALKYDLLGLPDVDEDEMPLLESLNMDDAIKEVRDKMKQDIANALGVPLVKDPELLFKGLVPVPKTPAPELEPSNLVYAHQLIVDFFRDRDWSKPEYSKLINTLIAGGSGSMSKNRLKKHLEALVEMGVLEVRNVGLPNIQYKLAMPVKPTAPDPAKRVRNQPQLPTGTAIKDEAGQVWLVQDYMGITASIRNADGSITKNVVFDEEPYYLVTKAEQDAGVTVPDPAPNATEEPPQPEDDDDIAVQMAHIQWAMENILAHIDEVDWDDSVSAAESNVILLGLDVDEKSYPKTKGELVEMVQKREKKLKAGLKLVNDQGKPVGRQDAGFIDLGPFVQWLQGIFGRVPTWLQFSPTETFPSFNYNAPELDALINRPTQLAKVMQAMRLPWVANLWDNRVNQNAANKILIKHAMLKATADNFAALTGASLVGLDRALKLTDGGLMDIQPQVWAPGDYKNGILGGYTVDTLPDGRWLLGRRGLYDAWADAQFQSTNPARTPQEQQQARAQARAMWLMMEPLLYKGDVVTVVNALQQSKQPSDVLELYKISNGTSHLPSPEQKLAIDRAWAVHDRIRSHTRNHVGSDAMPSQYIFHRASVEEETYISGVAVGQARQPFMHGRKFRSEQEGVDAGTEYVPSVELRLQSLARQAYNRINNHYMVQELTKLGRTHKERVDGWTQRFIGQGMSPETAKHLASERAHTLDPFDSTLVRAGSNNMPATLASVFYTEENAAAIARYFGNKNQLLDAMATLSNISKGVQFGFDAAVGQLHGLPLLFNKPHLWARAQMTMLRGAVGGVLYGENAGRILLARLIMNPKLRQAFMDLSRSGVMLSSMEDLQSALGRGSLIKKVATTLKLGRVVDASNASFSGFLDASKLMWYYARLRSLEARMQRPATAAEKAVLAEEISEALGGGKTFEAGMGRLQQTLEGLMLVAPRYVRSTFNVMFDAMSYPVAKGLGLGREQLGPPGDPRVHNRGRFAFGSLSLMGSAMTLAFLAYAIKSGMDEEEIEQRLNPASGRFLTVPTEINGTMWNVGFGGGYRSIIRLIGNTAKAIMDGDLGRLVRNANPEENPLARWFRSKSAALPSMAFDWVTGKDFLGQDITILESLVSNYVPLNVQTFAPVLRDGEYPAATLTEGGLGLMGMTAWPEGEYSRRRQQLEDWAQETYGVPYEKLNVLSQSTLVNRLNEEFPKTPLDVDKASSWNRIRMGMQAQKARTEELYEVLPPKLKEFMEARGLRLQGYDNNITMLGTQVPLTPAESKLLGQLVASNYVEILPQIMDYKDEPDHLLESFWAKIQEVAKKEARLQYTELKGR